MSVNAPEDTLHMNKPTGMSFKNMIPFTPGQMGISDQFSTARAYANQNLDLVQDYSQTMETLMKSFQMPESASQVGEVDLPDISQIENLSTPAFDKVLGNINIAKTPLPSEPHYDEVPPVSVTGIPHVPETFVASEIEKPTILFPSAPTPVSVNSITLPDVPDFSLPAAPQIGGEIVTPTVPKLDFPTFDAHVPVMVEPDAPVPFAHQDAVYNSDLKLALLEKVLWDIENGGTGLNVEVETALYDRAKTRQDVENEKLYRDVETMYGAQGFNLPPVCLTSKLMDIKKEISRKYDSLSREIMISQAELEQSNMKFSFEQAIAMEGMFADFFHRQNDRSLQAARAISEIGLQIHTALVDRQKLKLESYKTQASVFRERIEAEKARIEAFRVEMESAKISLENKELLFRIYSSQVAAIEVKAKIFSTTMESAKLQAEMEALKIETAKAENDLYKAKIEAEAIKVKIYQTTSEVEKNKALTYGEQVKAFETAVRAKMEEGQLKALNAENIIKANNQKLEQWRTELTAWTSKIDAAVKVAGLQVEGFKAEGDIFATKVQGVTSANQVEISAINAQLEKAKVDVSLAVAETEAAKEAYISLNKLKIESAQGVLNAGAQLAASAMNSVSASASLSESGTISASFSQSQNQSESTSQVTSESVSQVTSESTSQVTSESTSQVTSESTSQVTSQSKSEVKSESESKVKSESTSQVKSESKSEVKSESESNVNSSSDSHSYSYNNSTVRTIDDTPRVNFFYNDSNE